MNLNIHLSLPSPTDKLEEIERGRIGSHAPLPPEYLKALREAQLMRLNNMHANSALNGVTINAHPGAAAASVTSQSGMTSISTAPPPTLTMVTPVGCVCSDQHHITIFVEKYIKSHFVTTWKK